MPVVRGKFAEALAPGLVFNTFNRYREKPEYYRQFMNVQNSVRAFEEDFGVSGLGPLAPQGELERTTLDEPFKLGGVRFYHKKFGLGFEVSEEMRDDEMYGLVQQLAGELGRSSRVTAELYGHDVINNGFSSAKYVGRDGQPLFSTAHPVLGTGGTAANRPLVDVDLSQAALEAAWSAYQTQVDDRGMFIEITPTVLLVHTDQMLFARRLMETTGYPGGNMNDINPLVGAFKIIGDPYILDTDAWFLLAAPQETDLRFYWRKLPDTRTWDDPDSEAVIHKISQRHSTGFSDWHGTFGSPGA